MARRCILVRMQTTKTRHQFYLPDVLSAKLEVAAAAPASSKTDVLTKALTAWFAAEEGQAIEAKFGATLARQVKATESLERQMAHLTEVVGLLVRHQLTMTAHHPAFDAETRHLGKLRYEQFVRMAGELAAKGKASGQGSKPEIQQEFDL